VSRKFYGGVAVCILLLLTAWLWSRSEYLRVEDSLPARHGSNAQLQKQIAEARTLEGDSKPDLKAVNVDRLPARLTTAADHRALLANTRSKLDSDLAASIYAGHKNLAMPLQRPKIEDQTHKLAITQSRHSYEQFAEPPATAGTLFPSRGFLRGGNPREEASTKSPLTFADNQWSSRDVNLTGKNDRSVQKAAMDCSSESHKRWRGEARISSAAFVEPFLVCEDNQRFSIAVDWRTSDVCPEQISFAISQPIADVAVVSAESRRLQGYDHLSHKDRLSIRLQDGKRLLVVCDQADWALASAGAQPWLEVNPASG